MKYTLLPTNINVFTHIRVFIIKYVSQQNTNICTMQHRGEIIKEAVYKSGFSITELAKRLGKSRRWVYLMFENNSVSLDVILQIGKIIHHNFTKEIKDMYPLKKVLIDSPSNFHNDENYNEYWKNKYLRLLEEYNALLKESKNLPEN